MKTVFKYLVNQKPIPMPTNAKFVHFGIQGNETFAWFEVNPNLPSVMKHIRVYGTGHSIPETSKHLASLQDGPFVWHLYEEAFNG